MTHKIIVTRGIPGSGKSVFSKDWAKEDPKHRVRINRDDLRNMLGCYWVPSRESLITSMYLSILNDSMIGGYDIVIDNMNLNVKTIEEIQNIVKDFNLESTLEMRPIYYEVEFKDFFDIPLEVCIERDSKRENPVGEQVIRDIYNKYKDSYPL